MSTRSRIGLEQKDGTIISVYHHWDGYPEFLGDRLVNQYNNEKAIRKLIKKGNISTIESAQDWSGNKLEPKQVLYYADRGDEDNEAVVSKNVDDFFVLTNNSWGEFAYLFVRDGYWQFYENKTLDKQHVVFKLLPQKKSIELLKDYLVLNLNLKPTQTKKINLEFVKGLKDLYLKGC